MYGAHRAAGLEEHANINNIGGGIYIKCKQRYDCIVFNCIYPIIHRYILTILDTTTCCTTISVKELIVVDGNVGPKGQLLESSGRGHKCDMCVRCLFSGSDMHMAPHAFLVHQPPYLWY